MMFTDYRDLDPAESSLYTAPSVFVDPTVKMAFTDPKSERPIFYKGLRDKPPGFDRALKLLENGMLLQVECSPFVRYDHEVRMGLDQSEMTEDEIEEARQSIPDLVYRYSLQKIPDGFNQEQLVDYVSKFTDRSIRLLQFDEKKAMFLKDNLGRVTNYLVEKLDHLRFYKGAACSPKTYGSIAIEDFADPGKPKLLFLVYGLRPLLFVPPKGPHVYIPWEPCLDSSEEAYENPAKRKKQGPQ